MSDTVIPEGQPFIIVRDEVTHYPHPAISEVLSGPLIKLPEDTEKGIAILNAIRDAFGIEPSPDEGTSDK